MTIVPPEVLASPPDGSINSYGSLLKLDENDSLFLGSHDYEEYETKLVIGLVRAGDVCVDIGAMIGYYTMILANRSGPTGRVYAYEPDPVNFDLLNHNAATNGYAHVFTTRALVGASSGKGQYFPAPSQYKGDNRAYATADRPGVDIDVVALDDVITEPVDIVKIDVQGYEGHVLAGMSEVIARSPRLMMLVEYTPTTLKEAGTDPGDLLATLTGHGFSLFEIREEEKRVVGADASSLLARSKDESGDLWMGYTNLLCTRGPR